MDRKELRRRIADVYWAIPANEHEGADARKALRELEEWLERELSKQANKQPKEAKA
jgi:hypothetical protein